MVEKNSALPNEKRNQCLVARLQPVNVRNGNNSLVQEKETAKMEEESGSSII